MPSDEDILDTLIDDVADVMHAQACFVLVAGSPLLTRPNKTHFGFTIRVAPDQMDEAVALIATTLREAAKWLEIRYANEKSAASAAGESKGNA